MDISTLGFNAVAIALVVALTKVLTETLDKDKKLSRWYPLLPALLAIPAAILTAKPLAWSNWQAIAWSWAGIAGFASWAYKTGKSTILGK